MEEVFDKTTPFEETLDLKKVVGVRVLSEKGFPVGKVSQVRLNPEFKTLEGILVRRGLMKEPIYFGKTYFDTLSSDAIILNIEPTLLLRKKKVVTYDGEVVGKVNDVLRVGRTNVLKSLSVKSWMRGEFVVPASEIRSLGKSIILKNSYNAPKKSFWRRTR